MSIENKLPDSEQKRVWTKNILFTTIGVGGMLVFGSEIGYETIKMISEFNASEKSFSEFYQNMLPFLKLGYYHCLFGLNVINTYTGLYHKFYEYNPSEENGFKI